MNVLPVQPAMRFGAEPIALKKRDASAAQFSGGLLTKKELPPPKHRKDVALWPRIAKWLMLPAFQAAAPVIDPPRVLPSAVLKGETGKFYDLLENYATDVYSGRMHSAALDYFAEELEKIDADKLDNEDKAYHLMFTHDVGWRQFMNGSRLRVGYDNAVHKLNNNATLQSYRLGSPQNWVDRLVSRPVNPFRHTFEPSPLQKKSPGIGRETYEAILEHQLYAGMDSDTLIKTARDDYDGWLAEMNDLAKQIDPHAKNWRDVYEGITKNHPKRADVLDAYETEAARASKFLKDHDLVDVPTGYKLRIEETPDYYKPQLPFAAYVPSRMTFWVTTTMDNDPKTEEAQLRAHNYSDIKAVTVHEAFPGHHLDNVHKRTYSERPDRNDPKRDGRKFLQQSATWDSAPYSEGWGLYAETMMFDNGYYKNSDAKQEAADKLTALRCMLWRGARAFLDAEIHTNQIKPEDAVDFLVENLVMQRDRAEAEVNRYVENPGQVTTYYLGMKQFKEIWEKASLNNPQLTLKQFHNDMLKQQLPVPAVGLAKYGV